MTKKKPTKKEIETVISNMINHLQTMDQKTNAIDNLFGLYLEWKNEKDKFNKFVSKKVEERQSQVIDSYRKGPGESK